MLPGFEHHAHEHLFGAPLAPSGPHLLFPAVLWIASSPALVWLVVLLLGRYPYVHVIPLALCLCESVGLVMA